MTLEYTLGHLKCWCYMWSKSLSEPHVLPECIRVELVDKYVHEVGQRTFTHRYQVVVFQRPVLTLDAVVSWHTDVKAVGPKRLHPALNSNNTHDGSDSELRWKMHGKQCYNSVVITYVAAVLC